jgi:hypothetical protein
VEHRFTVVPEHVDRLHGEDGILLGEEPPDPRDLHGLVRR